jgi:LmbE family N-acetylglucosaminyl deacetylase
MTRSVVVAPHPDDEVLGCSTVLFESSVTVVQVTDGVPPWTPAAERDRLRSTRQAECARAWESLASQVDPIGLGFGDLAAWRAVEEVAVALTEVIGALGTAHVYLPAYQRGHPDHDATYLAGALARDMLADSDSFVWSVYGLYGFDSTRHLRFGWLPADAYGPVTVEGNHAQLLEAKGRALRQFSSQLWPDSALDLWIRNPTGEQFAPLPVVWAPFQTLPCFYDEQLGFGRHGASAAAVEAAFERVFVKRPA